MHWIWLSHFYFHSRICLTKLKYRHMYKSMDFFISVVYIHGCELDKAEPTRGVCYIMLPSEWTFLARTQDIQGTQRIVSIKILFGMPWSLVMKTRPFFYEMKNRIFATLSCALFSDGFYFRNEKQDISFVKWKIEFSQHLNVFLFGRILFSYVMKNKTFLSWN